MYTDSGDLRDLPIYANTETWYSKYWKACSPITKVLIISLGGAALGAAIIGIPGAFGATALLEGVGSVTAAITGTSVATASTVGNATAAATVAGFTGGLLSCGIYGIYNKIKEYCKNKEPSTGEWVFDNIPALSGELGRNILSAGGDELTMSAENLLLDLISLLKLEKNKKYAASKEAINKLNNEIENALKLLNETHIIYQKQTRQSDLSQGEIGQRMIPLHEHDRDLLSLKDDKANNVSLAELSDLVSEKLQPYLITLKITPPTFQNPNANEDDDTITEYKQLSFPVTTDFLGNSKSPNAQYSINSPTSGSRSKPESQGSTPSTSADAEAQFSSNPTL